MTEVNTSNFYPFHGCLINLENEMSLEQNKSLSSLLVLDLSIAFETVCQKIQTRFFGLLRLSSILCKNVFSMFEINASKRIHME